MPLDPPSWPPPPDGVPVGWMAPGDERLAVPLGPRPAERRIRWGIGDFFWVFVAGNVGAASTSALAIAFGGGSIDDLSDISLLVAGMIGQLAGSGGVAWLLLKWKGTGFPAHDLGLRVRARDWWWVLIGIACAFGNGILVAPLDSLLNRGEPAQEIVRTLQDSSGPLVILAAIGVAIFFPILEEVMYRGILLRSLARRTTSARAIGISAVVFGAVHLIGNLDAYILLVGLIGLGALSAYQAARTGELSRSILLHVGFNLIAAIALVVG